MRPRNRAERRRALKDSTRDRSQVYRNWKRTFGGIRTPAESAVFVKDRLR